MKNLIYIVFLFCSIQVVKAQEFLSDQTYSVVINEVAADKESATSMASIVFTDHREIVLSTFQVDAANRIEKIQVQSLKHPELEDVNDIIRINLSYSEPYEYTVSHYVMITNEVESIVLPPIVNIKSDTSTSETIYVFPNQILGNVNKITKMEVLYGESFTIEGVQVLQNYAWNDSDFGNSVSNF